MSDPFRPLGHVPLRRARFVERPNRFLVRARLSGGREAGRVVDAFLPNPGRMAEMLFPLHGRQPATPLHLVRAEPHATRRTEWTCVGLELRGESIFLHTHRTNAVARHLLDSERIPELRGWRVADAEVTVGRSRFDFLLERGRRRLWLEVKSCTLFGNGSAMFPDAVTERGRRHLLELARLRRDEAVRPVVLFVVHSPTPRWFLPDYHTDLAFSRTLLDVRRDVRVLPVGIRWNRDFSLHDETRTLSIPWRHVDREAADRGSYWLLLRLPRDRRIDVGRLGPVDLPAGWYLYVGSAMNGLDARLRRHQRRRKRMHWHIDYLRQAADAVVPLPVRASTRLECSMADATAGLYPAPAPGFGASDCDCPAHLFHAGDQSPLDDPAFHDILQRFRMPIPR